MKKMFLLIMLMLGAAIGINNGEIYATSGAEVMADSFLGLHPWYEGLPCGNEGTLVGCKIDENGEMAARVVWTIVLNIVADIALIIGYVAVGFVIYGGITMLTSLGDPGKFAKGRKALIYALTGVAIGILGAVIIRAIIGVLQG
jgi:hypothetical protein